MNTRFKYVKIGLVCWALIATFFNAHAQKGLRVGFNLIPNFSRASFLDTVPFDYTRKYVPGITTGLALQYGFNQGISFYTAALFSSKGFEVIAESNVLKNNIRGNVIALEIPFGFYLRQPLSKRTFLREQVGLTLSYNSNNEQGFFRFPEENPYAMETLVKKRINYLINIGVEVQHEFESGHFFSAGVVYRHGFGIPMQLNLYEDYDNRIKGPEMAYTGGYIGVNLQFLFDLGNLKPSKEEVFFR